MGPKCNLTSVLLKKGPREMDTEGDGVKTHTERRQPYEIGGGDWRGGL